MIFDSREPTQTVIMGDRSRLRGGAADAWITAYAAEAGLTPLWLRSIEETWWGDLHSKLTFLAEDGVRSTSGVEIRRETRRIINDLYVFSVPNLEWVTVCFDEHCVIMAVLPWPHRDSFILVTRVFASSMLAASALRLLGDCIERPSDNDA